MTALQSNTIATLLLLPLGALSLLLALTGLTG